MTIRKLLTCAVVWAGLAVEGTASPVRVTIPWEQSWPVVTPATASTFGFALKNEGTEAAEVQFSATLTSPSGGEEKVQDTVSLKPGEEKAVPWPLTKREMGCWTVDYAVTQKADVSSDHLKRKITFGYLDPAGPNDTKPEFMLGIVSHTERVSKSERLRELESAAFIGSKVMRTGSEWGKIQPEKDQWNWDTMDEIVATSERLGMQIQVLLAFSPQWTATPENQKDKDWLAWSRSSPNLEAWRKFVATYAERYKGRIHLWEPWNEPDLEGFWRGSTEEYIELFKLAQEELKKADPKNIVMSGGFATLQDHPSRKKNPDLQARAMKELSTKMDLHAVHEHGAFDRFAQVVDGPYAELRASLPQPAPPIFFNETAEHSMGGREKAQAMILVKKATFARARGAVGYLWYDLRNDGIDPGDPEHNFGLLTKSMEPKPAYIAFNTLAKLMVPRPYLKQLDAGENRWFFLHGDDQEKLLVFWNEDSGTQNEQILLRMPGVTKASLIDINGNATPLPLTGDLAVVTSNQEPHYLLAEGATSIELAGRLAGPDRAFFGAPGAEVPVTCEFFNPTESPVTVKTEWTLPSTMKLVKAAPTEVTIPARSQATSTVTVRLPEGANYQFGRNGKLRIAYEFQDLPYQGRLLIPVHYGTIAVPADQPDRQPDIVLDQQEQLTSFIEADPHMTPYRWKDAKDLSAKVWLKADSQDLSIKVAVTDNQHVQPGHAADMWMADSVQCIISLPSQKGSWELGFAEDDNGQPLASIWAVPSGFKDIRDKIRVEVEKQGQGRTYIARIPRQELGLTDEILRDGFRFNLAVNDNDGKVRAHALQIAPGIVANKSSDSAPYVVFKEIPSKTP